MTHCSIGAVLPIDPGVNGCTHRHFDPRSSRQPWKAATFQLIHGASVANFNGTNGK
jgi:hypothetical protein